MFIPLWLLWILSILAGLAALLALAAVGLMLWIQLEEWAYKRKHHGRTSDTGRWL
jgi:hypothetical protein